MGKQTKASMLHAVRIKSQVYYCQPFEYWTFWTKKRLFSVMFSYHHSNTGLIWYSDEYCSSGFNGLGFSYSEVQEEELLKVDAHPLLALEVCTQHDVPALSSGRDVLLLSFTLAARLSYSGLLIYTMLCTIDGTLHLGRIITTNLGATT